MEEKHKDETNELKTLSSSIFIVLSIIIIISRVLKIWMKELNISILLGCVIAGILGCASSALLSALERKAEGWEFDDGSQHPKKEEDNSANKNSSKAKREMFSKRMSTFFFYRPMLGIVAASLIFFGFGNFEDSSLGFDQHESKIIFLSLLAGLFAKSLLEKMKGIFDNLIGKK
jgi:hypothetical protein